MSFSASVSDQSLVNPHGTKRQRRPSVRLGEIGDQPAAFMMERRSKKETIDQSASSLSVTRTKETIDHSSYFLPERTNKGTVFQSAPLLAGKRKKDALNQSADSSTERRTKEAMDWSPFLVEKGNKEIAIVNQHETLTAEKRKKPISVLSNHSRLKEENTVDLGSVRAVVSTPANGRESVPRVSELELNQSSHAVNCKKTPEKLLKNINGEGRNTKLCSKLGALTEDVEENTNDSDSKDGKDVHSDDKEEDLDNEEDMENIQSDEGNECHTPEGFQDCDLDELEYHQNNMKESSYLMENRPLVKSQAEQNCQKIFTEDLLQEKQVFPKHASFHLSRQNETEDTGQTETVNETASDNSQKYSHQTEQIHNEDMGRQRLQHLQTTENKTTIHATQTTKTWKIHRKMAQTQRQTDM